MAELSKCRICKCQAVRLADGRIGHEPSGPWCPLQKSDHMTFGDWQTLMGGGEPVAWISHNIRRGGKYVGFNPVASLQPGDYVHEPLYTHSAPAVDGAVLLEELVIATGMIREICHCCGISPPEATLRRLDATIATIKGEG